MKRSSIDKIFVFTVSLLASSYLFENWDEFKRGLRGQPSQEIVTNND